MSADSNESQPKSFIDRLNEILNQEIQSGELRETSVGTFRCPYLRDPRYFDTDPAVKSALEQLNIPDLTVLETEKAVRDLKVKKKITVTTVIATAEEMIYVIPSLGIGGMAISQNEVRYFIDPTHPKVVESLRIWKRRQIAHETNHIARSQSGKRNNTLLDALISEGLATHYEEHWGGAYQPTPWGHVLSEEKLMSEWDQARSELRLPTFSHKEWFFGQNGKHPVWAGYSIGTAIVYGYLSKHPRTPMSQLVRKPSMEILKKSGFS